MSRGALLSLSLLRGLAGPGLFSSLGVFFPVMTEASGGSLGSLSLSVSLASVAGACFLPLAGRLYERLDFRRVTFFGVLLMTVSYMLFAASSAPLWRALISLPLGCGMVMLVNLMAPCYLRFLGADTGRPLGLLVALSGLTGAVFQPLLARALRAWGWRTTYLTFGFLSLAVMGIALLLLPPVAVPEWRDRLAPSVGWDGKREQTENRLDDRRGSTAVHRLFWSMFLYQGIITGFTMFHQHFSTFAVSSELPHRSMTVALTLSMLTSAAGALILGSLTRYAGAGKTGVGVLVLGGVSVLLFGFVGRSVTGFLMASALHGAVSGAIGVTVPAAAREVYRKEDYALSLSRIMVASPLLTLAFMQLYGASYDLTGGFGIALLCLFAALIIVTIVWWRAFVRRLPHHA